jgi:integrase
LLLTDIAIRALKPTGRQQKFWCSQTPNFGLLVSQAGGKSFFFMTPRSRRRIALGKWPATPLKEARAAARRLLLDPQSSALRPVTFCEAFTAYYDRRIVPNYRPRTATQLKGLVERHAAMLSSKRIAGLSTQELADLLAAPTITPTQANHLYGVLRTFFKWAQQQQYLARSPLTFSKPHKDNSRDRVLSDDELRRVYLTAQTMGHPFGFIILFCVHTGLRKNNVAHMKWTYITEEYINLPGSVMKSEREHILPNLLTENLKLIPKTSEYLFPSSVGKPFNTWTSNKLRLDELSGVSGYCIHDLRRTFSSKLAEWKCAPPDIIERLLGHTTALSPIARVYNKWHYLPQMREALELYEKHLAALLAAT